MVDQSLSHENQFSQCNIIHLFKKLLKIHLQSVILLTDIATNMEAENNMNEYV